MRLVAAVLAPILFMAILEGGLRLFGYGFPTGFLVKTDDGREYRVNDKFARQFYPGSTSVKSNPFRMPAVKDPETIRIFVLGESAALGTPNPAYSFSRILETMLRSRYPRQRFEVFNAAMRGINSHVILEIARDCSAHQPDLFIVYMGNNEVAGLHAPRPKSSLLSQNLTFIRCLQRIRSTRSGQLLTALLQKPSRAEQDMDFFRAHRLAADDRRRRAVCDNFRANLEEMCDVMTASGAKVILSTVPVNLRDFPPLASLHRADLSASEQADWERFYRAGITAETATGLEEAITQYEAAARIDDQFADLQFRLAQCHLGLGRWEEALKRCVLACDRDALAFRADSPLNEIIRTVAAQRDARGVTLIDMERTFAESDLSDHRVPGDRLFSDHVHLKFAGDYLVAQSLYPVVAALLGQRLGPAAAPPLPSRQQCAEWLAYTDWDELQTRTAMVKLTSLPPFLDQIDHVQRQSQAERELKERSARFSRQELQKSIALYHVALERTPEDWQLHHNFGMLCYLTHDYLTAAQNLAVEVQRFPDLLPGRLALGAALASAGKTQEARDQFEEVLRINPGNRQAKQAIAALGSVRR